MEQRCFRNQGKSNSCLVFFVYLFIYLFLSNSTVNCRLLALDLYISVRCLMKAYKRRGLHPKGFMTGIEKGASK